MATLTDVNVDRSIFEASYMPEAMLAEATVNMIKASGMRMRLVGALARRRCAGALGMLNGSGDVDDEGG